MLMSNHLHPDELFGLAGTTDSLQLFNDAGEIQYTKTELRENSNVYIFLNVFSGQNSYSTRLSALSKLQRYQSLCIK